MQTAANISLVLTDCSSFKRFAGLQRQTSYGGFYQQVASELVNGVYTKHVWRDLGERLVVLAERAHAFRQMDVLQQVSQVLVSAPLPRRYEAVGRYYQTLCIHNFGRGDVELAAHLLEPITGEVPPRYRAKAMLSMGSMSVRVGNNQSAVCLYREANRFASSGGLYDPYVIIHAQRNLAVIDSKDGNHRDALAMLENLFPLAYSMRSSQPHVYYDYLNSLAVELGELGRLQEASNVSQIVLASPLVRAYPEWRETSNEIALRGRRPSRSVVAFHQPTDDAALGRSTANVSLDQSTAGAAAIPQVPERGDVVSLPVREHHDTAVEPSRAAPSAAVINIQEWKDRVPERNKTRKDRKAKLRELEKLTIGEIIAQIWGKLGDEDVGDELLRKALLLLEHYELEENQGS